jgi:hypothetical protein
VKIRRIDNTAAIEIEKSNGDRVLVSYSTPVAAVVNGVLYRTDCNYSNTTSRHISAWGCKFAKMRPQSFFDALL